MSGTMAYRLRRVAAHRCAAALVASACATPALAVLGGSVASIDADSARLAGRRQTMAQAQGSVRIDAIVRHDGSVVREYVSGEGVVFAVAWNTRLKPDLAALLGAHAEAYGKAARRAMASPGIRRQVVLEEGDLVVHATSHLNAFTGRAWLKSMLPAGVPPDAIR